MQNGNDDDDLDDAFMESDQNYRDDRKGEGQAEGYEEEDDNYFEEDDFESYGEVVESKIRQSPIVKPKNSSISLVTGGGSGIYQKSEADAGAEGEDEGNIFDDDDEGGGTATEAGGEGEEEIDFENQSMTLESYMEEFFKRKYENHNVKENENDPTPDAVDPTGLDGVSPGPGQRHINGTDSPFHFELDCFSPRSPRHTENLSGDPCSTLANILTKVQDVQTQLIEISTKVDPATSISGSPLHSSSKKKLGKGHSTAVAEEHLSPAQDMKIEILKKDLRKKTQELREQKETIENLQAAIMDQTNRLHLLEDDLKEERNRFNKAVKQKNKSLQTMQKMSQELEKCSAVMNAVNEMKSREQMLVDKVKELTQQNHDLTAQLKSSMARELEWRALFRSEQSSHGAHALISDGSHQSSRLASHRSLPDHDSDHRDMQQLPKVAYERKSHTERREKKKKISARNLPKIPKKTES